MKEIGVFLKKICVKKNGAGGRGTAWAEKKIKKILSELLLKKSVVFFQFLFPAPSGQLAPILFLLVCWFGFFFGSGAPIGSAHFFLSARRARRFLHSGLFFS